MCIAVVVGSLGRVATTHQIAPWSEDMTCLSHHAVGAAFRADVCCTASGFLLAVLMYVRRKTYSRTQHDALSAAIAFAARASGPGGQEARRRTHRVRARK